MEHPENANNLSIVYTISHLIATPIPIRPGIIVIKRPGSFAGPSYQIKTFRFLIRHSSHRPMAAPIPQRGSQASILR